jgi:hypothetical protein
MTTINVTQEDINVGTPGDCHDCPVATAIIHALELGERDYVVVNQYYIFVRRAGEWDAQQAEIEKGERWDGKRAGTYYTLPESCREFIALFDGDEPVEPFSFELIEDPQPDEIPDN